jgi:phosphoribosylformimino-5-aminoimidazole carboxamide ribotide isomerase
MTKFRPVLDLHRGKVKQIVGGSLTGDEGELRTNFVSDRPAAEFARMYREDGLEGGHVIMLGPGNRDAALGALAAYPGGLQVGGGITPENAGAYLEAGAAAVIVTSWMFDRGGRYRADRVAELVEAVGAERVVLDLSCRRVGDGWSVAMNRWQTITDMPVDHGTLEVLAPSCAEFLIHAADVEGKCEGIDEALVEMLGGWRGRPITYAGGARALADLDRVAVLSGGTIDLAIGSALDIFGGGGVRYQDCVAYNRRVQAAPGGSEREE